MRNKMNAMASTISHAEDCIMEVQHWLEEKNNPDNPYVRQVSIPRLKAFKKKSKEYLKTNYE